MKKGQIMQSVQVVKTGRQPVRAKVVAFMGKVECKKYPKAVWNFINRHQKMQVKKLCKQQGIKPTIKQTSTDARIAALEVKIKMTSQPEE